MRPNVGVTIIHNKASPKTWETFLTWLLIGENSPSSVDTVNFILYPHGALFLWPQIKGSDLSLGKYLRFHLPIQISRLGDVTKHCSPTGSPRTWSGEGSPNRNLLVLWLISWLKKKRKKEKGRQVLLAL